MTDGETFSALILRETDDGSYKPAFEQLDVTDLQEGDVLVAVEYSSLNYKDGLAVTGKGKIARRLPLIPGIDLAGTVLESSSAEFSPGDPVLLTGYGVGEKHYGGYAQRARVWSEWLVPMPQGLDSRRAMAIGTAGFTAMLCVMALEEGGVTPDRGPVLVTGAAGGVGSIAVSLLAALGYEVVAVTGRPETHEFLSDLGAARFVDRETMSAPARPLETQLWAGAVDAVGSTTLARVLAETSRDGTVAACGLAGGIDLPATVMPFILRGVRLQGIDSVQTPMSRRREAWARLGRDLSLEKLDQLTGEVPLSAVVEHAGSILAGRVRGRTVVNVNR
jgi:acrylyl-CoA reductase (NADPH)